MNDDQFITCKLTPPERQQRGCRLNKNTCPGCTNLIIAEEKLGKSQGFQDVQGNDVPSECLDSLYK